MRFTEGKKIFPTEADDLLVVKSKKQADPQQTDVCPSPQQRGEGSAEKAGEECEGTRPGRHPHSRGAFQEPGAPPERQGARRDFCRITTPAEVGRLS